MRTVASFIIFINLVGAVTASAGEKVVYRVGEEDYEGYCAVGKKDSPLILLVHDWDGLTDYEIKRSDMLAELGYTVFAVDLFGAGNRPAEVAERRRLTGELYDNREKMRNLLLGALAAAKKQGADLDRAVAMGYCFGGAAVLELARSGADLKGFVSFHGGLSTPEGQDYSAAKGEILVLHGTADSAVPMEDFTALARELEEAGVAHEMITYGGAQHAFTEPGGERYHPEADRKSWRRFREFLEDKFGG
jgi:dienelactone hydrolase